MLSKVSAMFCAVLLLAACGEGDEDSGDSESSSVLKDAYDACDSTNAELTGGGTVLSVDAPDSNAYMVGMACILDELDPSREVLDTVQRAIVSQVNFETVTDGDLTYVITGLPGIKTSMIVSSE